MLDKAFIIILLFVVLSLQGCQTLKNMGNATARGVQKADAWVREHMW